MVRSVRPSSDLADCLDRGFDALGVFIPEFGEVGLIEIGDDVAEVVDRLLERLGLDRLLAVLAQLLDDGSGVPLGANSPTQSENRTS